jgi:site-specific recombinase XerD
MSDDRTYSETTLLHEVDRLRAAIADGDEEGMAILVERLRQMVQTNIEGEAVEKLTTYRVRVSAARSLYAWVTVEAVNAEEARDVIGKAWRKDKTLPKPVRPQQTTYLIAVPPKLVLMGLNDNRDCYEVVYDPHDIGGDIDPMMLDEPNS